MYYVFDTTLNLLYTDTEKPDASVHCYTTDAPPTTLKKVVLSGGTIDPTTKECTGHTYVEGAMPADFTGDLDTYKKAKRLDIDYYAQDTLTRLMDAEFPTLYVWIEQLLLGMEMNDWDDDDRAVDEKHPKKWKKNGATKKHEMLEEEAAYRGGIPISAMSGPILAKMAQQQTYFAKIRPIRVTTKEAIDAVTLPATPTSADYDTAVASIDAAYANGTALMDAIV